MVDKPPLFHTWINASPSYLLSTVSHRVWGGPKTTLRLSELLGQPGLRKVVLLMVQFIIIKAGSWKLGKVTWMESRRNQAQASRCALLGESDRTY